MSDAVGQEFELPLSTAAMRRESIIHVRTVLLTALLAMSRNFLILDASYTPASTIAALAAVTLVLGAVY